MENKIELNNFDIEQIANSGQCFRIKRHPEKENTWKCVTKAHYCEVTQVPGEKEVVFSCDPDDLKRVWWKYFDLDGNYQKYINAVDEEDEFLRVAVSEGSGIRILKQDAWEATVSFMISQNNNIPRIKKTIELMCVLYGTRHEEEDGTIWAEFPTATQLCRGNLENIGLGYRDKYIKMLAENVKNREISLRWMENKDVTDSEAENYLKSIYGIGPKVANCIMLFGLHRLDSVPKDTWMNKAIAEHYNGKFPTKRYEGFSGVMQQYIFYYMQQHKQIEEEKNRG